jgi:hypothetical protein
VIGLLEYCRIGWIILTLAEATKDHCFSTVEVLQDGRGTDVKKQNKSIIDADGFILVSGKKRHTGGYADNAVAAARNSHDEKSKIVSRSLS